MGMVFHLDKMHLGRIVRKLKTFTATIYRKMKAIVERVEELLGLVEKMRE